MMEQSSHTLFLSNYQVSVLRDLASLELQWEEGDNSEPNTDRISALINILEQLTTTTESERSQRVNET